jgi:hypothetical protein
VPTLQQELKDARQEVRNLQVMQMRPDQSAEKLKLLADLERSARLLQFASLFHSSEVGEGICSKAFHRTQLRP